MHLIKRYILTQTLSIICAFCYSQDTLFANFMNDFGKSDIVDKYLIKPYLEHSYLISDFNGDQFNDIAVLIENKKTKSKGIIIHHFTDNTFHIIGAGQIYQLEDKWGDLNWVNKWKINTKRINEPGVQGGQKLKLTHDSIEIIKSEVGGGLIYWTGKKYAYFHQTC